jgi:hypothetical protein
LLNQVRRDKIGVDEALAQAATIRTDYLTSAQSLTDKKTRNIALKDVSRLDSIISDIKAAGAGQARRQELDRQLVPEFAGGAYIVPGVDLGRDSFPAMLRPGEAVLNKRHIAALGGYSALSRIGVPSYVPNGNYQTGGIATPSRRVVTNTDEMNVYIVMDKKFAEQQAVEGRDKILTIVAADIRDEGKVSAAFRKVR